MKLKTIIFASLLLIPLCVGAQVADTHWDTNGVDLGHQATILLGDQLHLVSSSASPSSFASLQQLSDDDIIALSQHIDTLTNSSGVTSYVQRVVMTSFTIGRHAIALPQADTSIAPDSLILIVMDLPEVDTTKAEIKDLSLNFKEPYTFWEIFRWILLALILAAIAYAIIFLLRRRAQHQPIFVEPEQPPMPVDEKALTHLETLRTKGLWQRGMLKEYHTELTDIIREYLHDEYAIESAEMTSDQTLEAYRGCRGWNQLSDEKLRQILRTADMVKFAKHEPQSYEHDLAMSNAMEFVRANAAQHPSQSNAPQGDNIQ